ncbi:MAG: hypothetical protein LLG05_02120 [Porphyromonadaceae bacterium]|nr:hypothetical protein [Porphyromonadaceae bacterium]
MKELVLTQKTLAAVKQSLIDGLTVASGAKSSATYYHGKDEQLKAIQTQIKGMYKLSKELPLIVASQKGATGKFVAEVLLNEFQNTLKGGACNIVNPIDWYDNGLSDKAVLTALNNLGENGLPYVLRLFVDLKNAKVNNERSRKIVLGFIWGQDNLEFYAMKYRNKLAEILRHVYGKKMTSVLLSIAGKAANVGQFVVGSEKEMNIVNEHILRYYNGDMVKASKLLLFIFKKDTGVTYGANEFPLLSEYMKAKVDITSTKKVPEEVLLGLISNVRHPQYHSMWATDIQKEATKALIRKNVEVTSVNQQVRQTKSTAKLGVEKTVDLEKATDFLALYKTGYENGWTEDLHKAIDKLAEKKRIPGFFYQNIGVIVDDSISMTGHKAESKNTPKAIADFTARVLGKSAQTALATKTDGEVTDLASSFVQLLKAENPSKPYDAIFILTDGYENAYDGLTNEVISIWKAETGRDIPMFQISPITSAEMGANVRKIGANVVTMAINNPVALQPQINARLLEIDTKRWLENQVLALEAAPVKRTKKISINA